MARMSRIASGKSGATTWMAVLAVNGPMVAEIKTTPTETGVTVPRESTVRTLGSLELHWMGSSGVR